ncbi:hypothetical protein EDD90_3256 [Streptomyces sp. Ag109_O5-1]|uniref:hypothetical protein n=1 Tax=Streptomyces sp. Ag109_O5-1 TaxID=1938851 RepID=UPI000F4F814A|nr:hypothetical protein [Streptomyces sp. Ag109_O5-1]RPE40220.1 hypothetical protein EDD90_3256 [Streptomyces sp. Ag109_O5-1]
MDTITTALGAYGIACVVTWSLFVPRSVRALRAPRRTQLAERVADAQARTGVTPEELEDAAFVRRVQAELKDYGAGIADYYDKGES